MSSIVIAGAADSPYYSQIERLADQLDKGLANCQVRKIVKQPNDWDAFVWELCYYEKWDRPVKPVIAWREPLPNACKRLLIGGVDDFQEFCLAYYGIQLNLTMCSASKIAKENLMTKIEIDAEEAQHKVHDKVPVKLCFTSAAGCISYNILLDLLRGYWFGLATDLSIVLYEDKYAVQSSFSSSYKSDKLDVLRAMQMEIIDCASDVLHSVLVTSDAKEAFSNADYVILLGEDWQAPSESRADFEQRFWSTYSHIGSALDWFAKSTVKIISGVTDNGYFVDNIVFTAMSSSFISRPELSHNFLIGGSTIADCARAVLSEHLDIMSGEITDVVAIGERTSGTMFYIHLDQGKVYNCSKSAINGPPGYWRPLKDVLVNEDWLQRNFLPAVSERLRMTRMCSGNSCAITMSNALNNTVRRHNYGDDGEHMTTLGFPSQGTGLLFNFPVRYVDGRWKVVDDLELSMSAQSKITRVVEETQAQYRKLQQPTVLDPNKSDLKFDISYKQWHPDLADDLCC